jgi:hypothetical protein
MLPDGAVEIGILGPVTVAGWPGDTPPRPSVVEILAFLALHPGRAWPTDALTDRLNQRRGRELKDATVRTYLISARQTLGADRLPDATRTGYILTGIGTDWDRFNALTTPRPDRTPAVQDLVSGLALVRGDTAERAGYDWLGLTPIPAKVATAIPNVANRVARHALDTDDRNLAAWAIERGLLVDPLNETLHTHALTVAARTDRAALTRAWTAVTLRHAAHDEPVPDTLTHHHQHLRTSPNQP